MDAIQRVQREVLGWSMVQYSFAVSDKKKTLLEDLLNDLHLASDFTSDLSCKLERKEFWASTAGENTTNTEEICVINPENDVSLTQN